MKKIGKIIITALLLILCVGAFGSIATSLDKSNIGGGSNDVGFVDTTETNLYVGLKKSNGSFTENPFYQANYGGFITDDSASATYMDVIDDDYLNEYNDFDVDCYQLAIDIHNEFYGSGVDTDMSTTDTSVSVWIDGFTIPFEENVLEFYGLYSIVIMDSNERTYELILNNELITLPLANLSNFGLQDVSSILFVYGDYDYETSHDAYIRAVPLTYNSLQILIYENDELLFNDTFITNNAYFYEDERYEGYVLMDLSILTDKYCNNKSYYNWHKADGNFITIKTIDGSNENISAEYVLDKQGLYVLGLPNSNISTISVRWIADYEQN